MSLSKICGEMSEMPRGTAPMISTTKSWAARTGSTVAFRDRIAVGVPAARIARSSDGRTRAWVPRGQRVKVPISVAVAVLVLSGCAHDASRGHSSAQSDLAPSTPEQETTAPPEPPEVVEESRSSDVLARRNDEPVPDVVGMKAETACRVLQRVAT